MDGALEKLKQLIKKNGAVLLVTVLGILLMLWPQQRQSQTQPETPVSTPSLAQQLEEILSQTAGAGETRVLLSLDTGEKTVYQSDETQSTQPDRQEKKTATVVISDSDRQKSGLVRQVESPTYRGAVVVCRGGGDPKVKLAVVEAVSGATGLPANRIVVLKMK